MGKMRVSFIDSDLLYRDALQDRFACTLSFQKGQISRFDRYIVAGPVK